MTYSIRLLALVAVNITLPVLFTLWLRHIGIDVEGSTISDNADNIGFAFDFLSFILVSLLANVFLLSVPGKNKKNIAKALALISAAERQKTATTNRRHRTKHA